MIIKKGDTVKIIAGKDNGKSGKVLKTFPARGLVTIDGINVYKKHVRPKREGEKGDVVSIIRPIRISNVMLFCSSCGKGVRVGAKIENDKKTRICKKCGRNF